MDSVDDRAPARLRSLPSWLLNQAAAQGARLVGDALAADGFSRTDFRVLTAIDEIGPASQADLGRHVWLDRSDLHAAVTALERRALIARHADPADGRRKVVRLTDAGRSTLRRLDGRVDGAQSTLLAALSVAERADLHRLLSAIVDTGQAAAASLGPATPGSTGSDRSP